MVDKQAALVRAYRNPRTGLHHLSARCAAGGEGWGVDATIASLDDGTEKWCRACARPARREEARTDG